MEEISNTVYRTYTSRFAELTPRTQLHFASRLSQWSDDPEVRQLLATVVAATRPADNAIDHTLSELLALQAHNVATINEYRERAEAFQKYPSLYGLHQALFQVRNWLYHYDIDARERLIRLADAWDYHRAVDHLLADIPALASLSTYAVNTIYLVRRLLEQNESVIFSPNIIGALRAQDNNDILLAYFATHCVIGETLFYARPLPADKVALYQEMLKKAETAITDIEALTLDAQIELLVVHALCGSASRYHNAILQRAIDNFDADLGFITDPKRPNKNDLEGAEHRNVLFLLATRPCRLAPR